jgi:shikimate kinase
MKSSEEASVLRILLIGLSCAGKSTLARSVAARWRLPLLSIDDFRREHGDNSVAGEYFARAHFLRTCTHVQRGIFEFSGSGIHRTAIRQAFRESPGALLTVWLDVPHVRRRERLAARSGESTPWPTWRPEAPSSAIDEEGHNVLSQDFAEHFWEADPGWRAERLEGDVPLEDLSQSFVALVTGFMTQLHPRGDP